MIIFKHKDGDNMILDKFKLDDCVDSIYGDVRDYDKLKTSILELMKQDRQSQIALYLILFILVILILLSVHCF